jgi:hypothetical protein
MKSKAAKQQECHKDAVLKHSRDIIWNASVMVGVLKNGLHSIEDYELEAQLEILSSYLGDAWERLAFIGDEE